MASDAQILSSMRFFNGLFSSKKGKQAEKPNLQNWGSPANNNNTTPVLLEYPSSDDDDSSVELSSSSTEDESHQLPYLPSKHGSHRRARCPPFGAKSLMGFRQSQEDAWSHMPEVAWLTVRSARRQSQPTNLFPLPGRTDQGEAISPLTPDSSNHRTSAPSLRPSPSSKRPSLSGTAAAQQPPAFARTLTSKGLFRPILQGGLAGLKGSPPPPFEPVPGLQGHHPVHFFAVFDGHGGSAVAKHCSKHLHKNLKEVFELAWAEAIAESAKSREQHLLHSRPQLIEHGHPGLQRQLSQSQHHPQQQQQQQQNVCAANDSGPPQEPQAAAHSNPTYLEQSEHVVPATGGGAHSLPFPLHNSEPCEAAHKDTALPDASPGLPKEGGTGVDAKAADAGALGGGTHKSGASTAVTGAAHKQGAAVASTAAAAATATTAAAASISSLSCSSIDGAEGGTSNSKMGAQVTPDSRESLVVDGGATCSSKRAEAQAVETTGAPVPAVDDATSSGSASEVAGGTGSTARPVAEGLEQQIEGAALRPEFGGGVAPQGVEERNSAAAAAAGLSSDPAVLPPEPPRAPLVVDNLSDPSTHALAAHGPQDHHHTNSSKSAVWPAGSALGHPSPAAPTTFKPDVAVCLAQAFVRTDQEVFQAKISRETGCTAVVLLTSEDNIWLANCGDSRAILCRASETVCLSDDHKASRPDEVARIEAAGGYVWWDRVMGELAVSRAIGDHCFSPFVIPEPEVVCMRRAFSDQLIILATDGMWDVFTNEEAHEAAWARFQKELSKGRSSQEAAKRTATWLVDKSIDRGSRDNVTVVVVDVRMPKKGSRKGANGAQARGSEQYQRGGTGDLGEEETAEGAEVDNHFYGGSAAQGQSEHKAHTAASVALGDGQSIGRQSGGKSKGGRKQKDGCGGIGKGCPKKQDAGRLATASGGSGGSGGTSEGEQGLNSLSTNSLPRRGFSSAANMNHFSVDEPPIRSSQQQQPGSKLKNTSNRQEPVVSEADPPSAPANGCTGCWCRR